jgi:hypothetical protein
MFPERIYLNWNSKKDWTLSFTDKTVNDLNFITEVNLRSIKKPLIVSGKIINNFCKITERDNISKKIHHTPLLKSNIQKAIRLGKTEEALVSSLNLIQRDIINFMRRLLIICIEDVGAIPDNYPLLVFILMAYPNIEITNEIIQTLLITVYHLSKYPKKYYPSSNIDTLDYDNYDYSDPITVSLIIASEYGGFKGDIALYNKMINSPDRKIIKIKYGELLLTRTICKLDIIPSAVDFHCFPWIIDKISEECNLKGDTVKSLIWNNSSKLNYREPHEIRDKEVWGIVTKIYDKIVKQILEKIYLK